MLRKVETYIKKWDMVKKEDRIIVGVSGGADSVCLLFVLLELRKKLPFELIVVHVNHGLRGKQADADERYVKELCKHYHLICEIYTEDVESIAKIRKQSTEEAGRDVRREAFRRTMEKYNGTKIALAHHQNDNAETFLMNLARGTGVKGLGGIKPIAGEYIRPLLCLERREIETYLKERRIHYCEDVTNSEDGYTRNRIRNHVIPYMEEEINEKVVVHINETIRRLQEVQTFLDDETNLYYQNCVREENGKYSILQENFQKVPQALQSLVVKKVLAQLAQREKDIEETHVQAVCTLMDKQVGRRVDLPYEMQAKRVYEGVLIAKKSGEKKEDVFFALDFSETKRQQFEWRGQTIICELIEQNGANFLRRNSSGKCFDYDIIAEGVCIRTRKQGDYITIHPDGGTQKIKTYFVNEKVPQEKREETLLLADGNHVMWIIGFRTNCRYHVTEQTKRILKIVIDKGENYGSEN